jgi:hypothetical protein
MILMAATLGTVTLTLHALYRADRRLRDALTHHLALDRFVAQLRSDTHQAVSATVDEPSDETIAAAGLVLSLPGDQTIHYTIRSQHIERVLRSAETVQHRETFPLPASSGWQIRADGASPVVSLDLKLGPRARSNEQIVARTCRVDAAVHLVRRRLPSPES